MTNLELDFSVVTAQDIPLLKTYLAKASYHESNHNLINMFMWQSMFPLYKYVDERFVLLLGLVDNKLFFYMPLCAPEDFNEAIIKAKALAKQANIPFVLSAFTKAQHDQVKQLYPNMFSCLARDGFDYVYQGEKLISLSGKKLQKRRNLYNQFVKNYQGRYQLADLQAYIPQVRSFLKQWMGDAEPDRYLRHEQIGIEFILEHFDQFEAKASVLLLDGEVKGFLIASTLSQTMIQFNIEKADKRFPGIYQVLEKEFMLAHFPTIAFVNREDDMGYENLRQAKLANQPSELIEKYRLCEEVDDVCKSRCTG